MISKMKKKVLKLKVQHKVQSRPTGNQNRRNNTTA